MTTETKSLEAMTKAELVEMAQAMGMDGVGRKNKDELVAMIRQAQQAGSAALLEFAASADHEDRWEAVSNALADGKEQRYVIDLDHVEDDGSSRAVYTIVESAESLLEAMEEGEDEEFASLEEAVEFCRVLEERVVGSVLGDGEGEDGEAEGEDDVVADAQEHCEACRNEHARCEATWRELTGGAGAAAPETEAMVQMATDFLKAVGGKHHAERAINLAIGRAQSRRNESMMRKARAEDAARSKVRSK